MINPALTAQNASPQLRPHSGEPVRGAHIAVGEFRVATEAPPDQSRRPLMARWAIWGAFVRLGYNIDALLRRRLAGQPQDRFCRKNVVRLHGAAHFRRGDQLLLAVALQLLEAELDRVCVQDHEALAVFRRRTIANRVFVELFERSVAERGHVELARDC